MGESGNMSRPSDTDELGLVVGSGSPFLIASTFFLTRPRRFSNLLVSMEAARLLTDLPGFASGLIIHHDDFPVPSFCTRMKRLCSDRLCRIEFCKKWKNILENYVFLVTITRFSIWLCCYEFVFSRQRKTLAALFVLYQIFWALPPLGKRNFYPNKTKNFTFSFAILQSAEIIMRSRQPSDFST